MDRPAPACNIGGQQRRKRLWIGIPLILVGLIGSFLHRSFLSQAVAFFGFLSYFQALDGT